VSITSFYAVRVLANCLVKRKTANIKQIIIRVKRISTIHAFSVVTLAPVFAQLIQTSDWDQNSGVRLVFGLSKKTERKTNPKSEVAHCQSLIDIRIAMIGGEPQLVLSNRTRRFAADNDRICSLHWWKDSTHCHLPQLTNYVTSYCILCDRHAWRTACRLYNKETLITIQTNSDGVSAVSGRLLVRLQLIIFIANVHPFVLHNHLQAASREATHT